MESLGNKYRPSTFDEVLGQDITIKILKRQMELEQPSHTYLFAGVTGGGKTTLARLINKYLNGEDVQPIEIDAASNSGVENVRSIIKSAQERSLVSKYKVFIIDECHALSSAAWQAFLKGIEETPKYTIFIFCTTEIQKVPETIKNRCQLFQLNRIPINQIIERLKWVCEQEGMSHYQTSIEYIAKISEGSMRNALAMLDKCYSYSNKLDINKTVEILGSSSYSDLFELINSIIDCKQESILSLTDKFYNEGKNFNLFVDQFLDFCLDLNKYSLFKSCDLIKIPSTMIEDLNRATNLEGAGRYYNLVVDKLLELKNLIRNNTDVKNIVEVYLLQMSRGKF